MRKVQVEIAVYPFHQLSEEAQDKVVCGRVQDYMSVELESLQRDWKLRAEEQGFLDVGCWTIDEETHCVSFTASFSERVIMDMDIVDLLLFSDLLQSELLVLSVEVSHSHCTVEESLDMYSLGSSLAVREFVAEVVSGQFPIREIELEIEDKYLALIEDFKEDVEEVMKNSSQKDSLSYQKCKKSMNPQEEFTKEGDDFEEVIM